jgi:precorrin-8X/cobalt-precorrin-8 methylmutase
VALHPITAESFAIIDREIGTHGFAPAEYRVVRRVIHATADFDFKDLLRFEHGALESGIAALHRGVPVIVDVQMVRCAVATAAGDHPLLCALDGSPPPGPGKTRTEAGLAALVACHPQAIYAVGNAPTALLALVAAIRRGAARPALVVGVPVGFVRVEESKRALACTAVPQIRSEGRKGGSPVAAAVVNALFALAGESHDG